MCHFSPKRYIATRGKMRESLEKRFCWGKIVSNTFSFSAKAFITVIDSLWRLHFVPEEFAATRYRALRMRACFGNVLGCSLCTQKAKILWAVLHFCQQPKRWQSISTPPPPSTAKFAKLLKWQVRQGGQVYVPAVAGEGNPVSGEGPGVMSTPTVRKTHRISNRMMNEIKGVRGQSCQLRFGELPHIVLFLWKPLLLWQHSCVL